MVRRNCPSMWTEYNIHDLAHGAFGHVFVLLFGTGHLMPSETDESHEGIEVVLEQCRAQNRQLISEMRKSMFLLCPVKLYNIFMYTISH